MKHQRGASYIAIMIAIIGFCFLTKILITIWAPYWDNHVMNGEIEALLKTVPKNTTPNRFIEQANQSFNMNGLRDTNLRDISQIMNVDGLQVKVNYEVRKNFIMNIDLVLKFEKDFDQRTIQTH